MILPRTRVVFVCFLAFFMPYNKIGSIEYSSVLSRDAYVCLDTFHPLEL